MKKIAYGVFGYHKLQTILLNSVILIVYILAGKLGLSFASVNPSATVLWAPTGIALASLLLFGYRIWPAIFVGAFVVNITTAGNVATSLGIALGNTLEGLIGAYLVKKFANGANAFEKVQDVFVFAVLAGLISTAVSAIIGVATLFLGGLADPKNLLSIYTTWWFGDIGGNLIVAPFIILLFSTKLRQRRPAQFFDLIFFFISVLIVSEVIFSGKVPYPYLVVPVLVWGAFRFSQKDQASAIVLLTCVAVWNTLHGLGPYGTEETNQSLLVLQLFLGVVSITSLCLTTALLERRTIRNQLQINEMRFRSLIEKSFDAVVLIDATSKILYASPSVKTLLGYTPEELIGTTGFNLVIPKDRAKTIKTLAALVLKPGGFVTVEYRTIRKDKKIIWVEATGTNLLFEPSVNAVVVNFRDITESKLAEQSLLQEKMEDEAMLGSIGEGIVATDQAGNVTMLNEAACEMLGWEEKELMGKLFSKYVPMEDESGKIINISSRPLTKVVSFGKTVIISKTNYYVRKDGTKFPVRFTITPIILDKTVVGTIEVFYDITKEKQVDRAKTEFVSLASHQLRTPLTTINWYLELLMKNKEKKKQDLYLQEVYSASQRMVSLINALLNASRLELGTFSPEPKKIDLVSIVDHILKEMHPGLERKNVILKKLFHHKIPQLLADPKLITIMVQNLISNAIKYSKDSGEIDLEISYDKKGFLIKVTDNGYGIPKAQQKEIFSKMFRADNARRLDPEGNGLGLYIVKSILDQTGGKIWFSSVENKETTFSVLIPPTGMKTKSGQKHLA